MPKKLNPDNNFKIEGFFGNMIKDSRKQENFKKSEDEISKYLIEKSKSKEKEAKELEIDIFSENMFEQLYNNLLYFYGLHQKKNIVFILR